MTEAIVVPLDDSELAGRALAVGVELGDALGAKVVAMTAIWGEDAPDPGWLDPLIAFVGHGRADPVIVRNRCAPAAIGEVTRDVTDPLLCMSTRGRGRIGAALLGSVAQDVVLRLRVPAVLLGPECAAELRESGPVLVCLDGSPASDAIVQPARDLADALGADVALVHVVHPLDLEGVFEPEVFFRATAERFGPEVAVNTHLLRSGAPADAIVHLAELLEPRLIAMATHGRTGLARLALGSVSTAVVRRSRCPVLVVRPEADGLHDD